MFSRTFFFLFLSSSVLGHGFLASPVARNTDRTTLFCPHCLSSGGVGVVYKTKSFPKSLHGVCGDEHGKIMHEGGGAFSKINGGLRMTNYGQGKTIKIKVTIVTNHGGYFQFKLCKIPDYLAKNSTAAERRVVTQQCFDKTVLRLLRGNAYFVDPGAIPPFTKTIIARLPSTLTCKRCVLQWNYVTANSCNPKGLPNRWIISSDMDRCGLFGNPEQFWNCADISIVPKGQKIPPSDTNSMIKPMSGGGTDGNKRVGFGYGTI